jgi:hypothetical protein
MNPKIKEALSCEIKKDEETERICTFIADFIKDYGYHLTYDKAIKIKCNFFLRGQKYNRKRIKENTIELYISGTDISRTITTTFSKPFFIELLRKEKASVKDLGYLTSSPYDKLEIKFKRE